MQPLISVAQGSMDLDDERCWRRLPRLLRQSQRGAKAKAGGTGTGAANASADPGQEPAIARAIERLPKVNESFALSPPTLDSIGVELALERDLRERVAEYRKDACSPSLQVNEGPELVRAETRTNPDLKPTPDPNPKLNPNLDPDPNPDPETAPAGLP